MIPITGDHQRRRQALIDARRINGIDYAEMAPDQEAPPTGQPKELEGLPRLKVVLLFDAPAGAYGLSQPPYDAVRITGGVRIRNFEVRAVSRDPDRPRILHVYLDRLGDLSTYTITIENQFLDPVFSQADFLFRPNCQTQFDSRAERPAAERPLPEPLIDYRAKDYNSFRTVLLDFVRSRVPTWDDSPADLGTTLLELMAYTGDQLSYYQEAVMNEAWLATARQRESVRRHARLIDYQMHDGCAARAFVHVTVRPAPATPNVPGAGQIAAGTPVTTAPGPEGQEAFAVMQTTAVDEHLNEMHLYDWGSRTSTLARGSTRFDLEGELPVQPGDCLLLEEVLNPATGRPPGADPARRQIVRARDVQAVYDPFTDRKHTRILIDEADALAHDFVVAAETDGGEVVRDITVVRGNLLLVEHGHLTAQTFPAIQPLGSGVYRIALGEGPLTFRAPFDPAMPASVLLTPDPRRALPRVSVTVQPPNGTARTWLPIADLLSSGPFDEAFVAETGNDGRAALRFGDGSYGRRPLPGSDLTAAYWTGNGTAGNVGAETLVIIDPPPAGAPFAIEAVRNPLPAFGGTDPEPVEQVRQLAPSAFRSRQFRAVTEADYAEAAETHEGVAHAVAQFRWTGSWHTVEITVDPLHRTGLTESLRQSVLEQVSAVKLAGTDIKISAPTYVPLEIAIEIEAAPGHLRRDVQEAVLEAFSTADLPDGRQGFFHPDRHTFAQPVYLSRIYAAVEAVPGVLSARVTTFKRYGRQAEFELANGVIPMARTEIARLDNDPNYPENGLLRLTMRGGL